MDIFKRKQTEVHMEQGPIGRTLLVFAAPILLSQILQQMYSIADCMIVGHFGGGNGLAAAGEAALILSVIINFFVGFSTGVSAITASAFGGFQPDSALGHFDEPDFRSGDDRGRNRLFGGFFTVDSLPDGSICTGPALSSDLHARHCPAVHLQYGKCSAALAR